MEPKPSTRSAKGGKQTSGVYSPRSIDRLLGLLRILSENAKGKTLSELSLALQIPKSSLLTMVRPLTAKAYLSHSDNRYRLGRAAFELGGLLLGAKRVDVLLRDALEILASETQETAGLATLDGASLMATYVQCIDSPHLIRYTIPVGISRPLYCTAGGLVLAAFQDEKWQESYLRQVKLTPMTPKTVSSIRALRSALKDVRSKGYAFSMEQAVAGAAGIAAPIRDASGKVTTALLIGAPVERLRKDRTKFAEIVVRIARQASSALGYREDI